MKHEAKENLRHDQGLVDGNTINQFCFWEEWVVGWKQVINSFVGRAGIDIGSQNSSFDFWKNTPLWQSFQITLVFLPQKKYNLSKLLAENREFNEMMLENILHREPQR